MMTTTDNITQVRSPADDHRPDHWAARRVGALALLLVAGGATAQEYAIQVLPPLPGYTDSFATGINDRGDVVGTSRNPTPTRGTLWVNGVPQDLGLLPAWTRTLPLDINHDGTLIVGEAFKGSVWVPFIWENGTLRELPAPVGMEAAGCWQVNDAGVIVGRSYNNTIGIGRACRWDKVMGTWTLTILSPLPNFTDSYVFGLNQAGEMAGASSSSLPGRTLRATRWINNVPGAPPGTANATTPFAGINDVGEAVGEVEVTPGGVWHATYYDGQSVTDLGALAYPNSYAHRINDAGTVIGQSYDNGVSSTGFPSDRKQAFIWRDGTMTPVNNLIGPGQGWDVKQLWDLNEPGQAVGYGRLNGLWRGCLLTPICYADCDTSTGAGILDIFDFLCFQNRYDAGNPYACDCDTSTGAGVCDIFDFLCFQNAYDGGCL